MKEVINTVLEDKIRIQAHSYKILFKKSYCSQAYGWGGALYANNEISLTGQTDAR